MNMRGIGEPKNANSDAKRRKFVSSRGPQAPDALLHEEPLLGALMGRLEIEYCLIVAKCHDHGAGIRFRSHCA
jgi:hypothetical protein